MRHVSGDSRGGLGRVGRLYQRSGTCRETLPKVRDVLGDVWNESWEPRGGQGWVDGPSDRSGTGRGPSGMYETGRETLPEVRNWVGDPRKGPGRVRRALGRSGTVWGTLPEVWDGSGDPPKGLGQVGGLSG